jgi:hypothetical protein
MKSMPICSFNTLEIYAKVIRDSDPIATVMMNINLKYPILFNKKWAEDNLNEDEKKEYLGKDDHKISDVISYKKELISLYIEKSINEEVVEGE